MGRIIRSPVQQRIATGPLAFAAPLLACRLRSRAESPSDPFRSDQRQIAELTVRNISFCAGRESFKATLRFDDEGGNTVVKRRCCFLAEPPRNLICLAKGRPDALSPLMSISGRHRLTAGRSSASHHAGRTRAGIQCRLPATQTRTQFRVRGSSRHRCKEDVMDEYIDLDTEYLHAVAGPGRSPVRRPRTQRRGLQHLSGRVSPVLQRPLDACLRSRAVRRVWS